MENLQKKIENLIGLYKQIQQPKEVIIIPHLLLFFILFLDKI